MRRLAIGVTVVLCSVVHYATPQTKPTTPVTPRSVLEAYISAWNGRDFAAFDKILAADAIHENVEDGAYARGPAEAKDWLLRSIRTEPDFKWQLTNVFQSGSYVAAEWTWTATHTGNSPIGPVVGMPISQRGATIAVIENGRIKRLTDYSDDASSYRKSASPAATGQMPAPQMKLATPVTPRSVLLAYISAWNRRDFAAFDKILAADAVHEDVSQGVHARGGAEIKELLRTSLRYEPDFTWQLTNVFQSGSSVAAEWTWTATHTGGSPIGPVVGMHIVQRGVTIAVVENGRVKRMTDYYDDASGFRKPVPKPAPMGK
jgi:steroid delta-isomerase-like uncharacterized protein